LRNFILPQTEDSIVESEEMSLCEKEKLFPKDEMVQHQENSTPIPSNLSLNKQESF